MSRRRRFSLPREHGFWTMLGAVQLAALLRVGPSLGSVLVLLGGSAAFAVAGGLASRAIRRRPALQLGSSAVLGASGLPLELLFGVAPRDAVTTAAAWVLLFLAGALLVRAAFARASRKGTSPARFEVAACGLGAVGALACALAGAPVQALVLAGGTVCFGFIARSRPTPKQVKSVGFALAAVATVAAVSFVFAPLVAPAATSVESCPEGTPSHALCS